MLFLRSFGNRRWRAPLLLMALCVVAYIPAMTAVWRGDLPLRGDAVSLFWAWRVFARQTLAQGALPFWNPHSFCGIPFLANLQTSVLYPTNIVYWVAPYPLALLLDALFHNMLLALGAYVLARSLRLDGERLSVASSFLAAIGIGLGGAVAAHIGAGHTTWHAARAYIPWELWATLALLRGGQMRCVVLLAMLFTLQLAAGYPPLWLLGIALCVALSLARAVSLAWQKGRVRRNAKAISSTRSEVSAARSGVSGRLLRLAVFALLTLALSAVYLLPMLEVSRLSVHGTEMSFGMVTYLSGRWPMLWRLAMPQFFGANSNGWSAIDNGAHEQSGYCGVLLLGLALLAPFVVRRPIARWLWALLPLSIVLSLGDATPLYRWLFDSFALFRQLRVPSRWIELWSFAVPLLAALAFETLLVRRNFDQNSEPKLEENPKSSTRLGKLRAVCALFLGVFFAATLWTFLSPDGWWRAQMSHTVPVLLKQLSAAQSAVYIAQARDNALMACVFALFVAGASLLLLQSPRIAPQKLRGALLVVAAFDLTFVFWQNLESVAARDFQKQTRWEMAQLYEPNQRWHTSILVNAANANMARGLDSFTGYDALMGERYFDFLRRVKPIARWDAWLQAAPTRSPLLRVASVTHFLSCEEPPMPAPDANFVARQNGWKLWRYPQAWPRFYLSRQLVRTAPDASLDAQLTQIEKLATQPLSAWRKTQPCVVARGAFAGHSMDNAPLTRQDRVLEVRRAPNRITIETQSAQPSVLVQSETFSPGWRAWSNGQPTKIENANFLFRGVMVPAGRAQTTLVFDSQTFRFALFISLGALSFVVAFVAQHICETKRRKHQNQSRLAKTL